MSAAAETICVVPICGSDRLPGSWPSNPIQIPIPPDTPGSPQPPIQLPPGTIWPPLPPDVGVGGKTAILIWVVGVGHRWFIHDASVNPPVPGPKK